MLSGFEKLKHLIEADQDHECEGVGAARVCVRVIGVARLPTRFGDFALVGFWNNREAKEHVALVHGDVIGKNDVLTRLHSECLTGDAFGSLRCDCRDQLEASLERAAAAERGVVLYLRQEGRGIGLLNKIRAYSLQDEGLDTVEANLALGFRDDERDYAIAAHMLKSLGIASIALMTNNPDKVRQLETLGVKVSRREAHLLPPNPHNRFYLETKRDRSGHFIELDAADQNEPALREDGLEETT